MAVSNWTPLARWMLAWQTLAERRTLLAYHDERGEGDAVRDALSAQHEAWTHLPTVEGRRAEYTRLVNAGGGRTVMSDVPTDFLGGAAEPTAAEKHAAMKLANAADLESQRRLHAPQETSA